MEKKRMFVVEEIKAFNKNFFYLFIKRVVDILLSFVAIIVFAIPMIVISFFIIKDGGPILFRQKRLGLNGIEFTLIKFRTMILDAEKDGFKWTTKNDPRITKIGRFLRKHRIDELPQIFNILKGEMSIVGPRPEVPFFYKEFEIYIKGFGQRLLVKPGLTGWAQINGGYDLKPEEKIVFDVEYIKKRNLFFDFWIIIRTVLVVLFRHGAN